MDNIFIYMKTRATVIFKTGQELWSLRSPCWFVQTESVFLKEEVSALQSLSSNLLELSSIGSVFVRFVYSFTEHQCRAKFKTGLWCAVKTQ